MKKFEAAVLDVLAVGDRFYFVGDKNKRVWQLHTHKQSSATVVQIGAGITKDKSYGQKTMKPVPVVFLTSLADRKQRGLE